uniref:Uncharacterized protein n=1 Tax=uncultured marine thaumarchaeote AD1000_01_F04 TaxID=1455879 RepID=A0A075FL21_9ARCH|nr:hypothetical protein [uncultured marine thaumarchaeote AD1000_01_F04]
MVSLFSPSASASLLKNIFGYWRFRNLRRCWRRRRENWGEPVGSVNRFGKAAANTLPDRRVNLCAHPDAATDCHLKGGCLLPTAICHLKRRGGDSNPRYEFDPV